MGIHGCSVVVSTYNRLPYLKQCMPSLLQLQHTPLEIIIVDDGSSDGTREYLSSFTDSRLRIVRHEKNRGLSAGRNSGVAVARLPIIAFTDDDCIVDPQWVARMTEPFADPSVGLTMGSVYYVRREYRGYFPERIVQNLGARWPKGCNVAYRRSVFVQLGNFSDAYYRYQNEDTEMAIRTVATGFRFRRVPEAVVYHQPARWTVSTLLASAHNAAVWPWLKRKYPRDYQTFGSPVRWGFIVHPEDYVYIFLSAIVVSVLLGRYLWHGGRNVKIFFAKWPLYFLLRRWHIWRSAVQVRRHIPIDNAMEKTLG